MKHCRDVSTQLSAAKHLAKQVANAFIFVPLVRYGTEFVSVAEFPLTLAEVPLPSHAPHRQGQKLNCSLTGKSESAFFNAASTEVTIHAGIAVLVLLVLLHRALVPVLIL